MQQTSQLYQSIISGLHRFEVKVNIAGTDYGMDKLVSLRTANAVFGTGSPQIGLAPAGEISLSVYAEYAAVPRMAELRPYVRVVNDTQQSEWTAKGVYYLDTREANTDTGLLTIHGYDAMLMAERGYSSSSHSWPSTDIAVVREIATTLGLTLDSRTTALMTSAFSIPLPAQYTMRETLQYIAALYGGSFLLTDTGTLRLVCLWNLASTADAAVSSHHRLGTGPAFPACTGVRFLVDDDLEVFSGNTNGYVYEITCPFATQAAADALLNRMRNFVYRPYTAENAVLDPALELGDTLSVDGDLSGLFSCTLNFDSLCAATVSAPEDEELDHEYPYESSTERRFSRRMKAVRSELSLQAEQIAARVTRTGGDASSFGWTLDAEKFQLMSNGSEVVLVNRNGLVVRGRIEATAGTIGGCSIENGTLKIQSANIDSINAAQITAGTLSVARIASKSLTGGKIADETLDANKLADSAVVNRTIGSSAVSYGKTSFQGTLDQVGTNKANIDTLFGYFSGAASFSSVLTGSLAINSHYLSLETITIGGVSRKVVTWN